MHERDLPSNIPTQHYFTGERRLQKMYTVIYTVRQPLEGKTCFITCVFIYIIYRFYTDFSLFRQIKRQDTVNKLTPSINYFLNLPYMSY